MGYYNINFIMYTKTIYSGDLHLDIIYSGALYLDTIHSGVRYVMVAITKVFPAQNSQ